MNYPRFEYDRESGAIYIRLKPGAIRRTHGEMVCGIIVNYDCDENGEVGGIEILMPTAKPWRRNLKKTIASIFSNKS